MPSLIVVAHPDDETLGSARLLLRTPGDVTLVHVTDGAPRQPRFWQPAGYASHEAYARTRREELACALALAGVAEDHCVSLGYADQEAARHLPELSRHLRDLIADHRPEVVYTHPYEGGHPDHDSCAFALAMALRQLARDARPVPEQREFTSYHLYDGAFRAGQFLEGSVGVVEDALTAAEQARKQVMLACFASQQRVVSRFATDVERHRPAPAYDFTQAPHAGPLYYETRELGMTGVEFRRLAAEAA